jgi:hypothetical protein
VSDEMRRKIQEKRLTDLRLAYRDGCHENAALPEYLRHDAGLLAVEAWVLRDLELSERGRL